MRPAGYSLHKVANEPLGECQLWGFWDLPVQESFEDAFEELLGSLARGPDGFSLLVDASRWPAQRPVVITRLGHLLQLAEGRGLKRCALLTGHTLLPRFQLRRLRTERAALALFDHRREAERWLRLSQPA